MSRRKLLSYGRELHSECFPSIVKSSLNKSCILCKWTHIHWQLGCSPQRSHVQKNRRRRAEIHTYARKHARTNTGVREASNSLEGRSTSSWLFFSLHSTGVTCCIFTHILSPVKTRWSLDTNSFHRMWLTEAAPTTFLDCKHTICIERSKACRIPSTRATHQDSPPRFLSLYQNSVRSLSSVANVLDNYMKPDILFAILSDTSQAKFQLSITIITEGGLFGYVIYSSADPQCWQC